MTLYPFFGVRPSTTGRGRDKVSGLEKVRVLGGKNLCTEKTDTSLGYRTIVST